LGFILTTSQNLELNLKKGGNMEILKSIKLRQLRKERDLIQANKKAWINLHRKDNLDASISRTFLAYQNAINKINESIRKLQND
jgi:hypothetical protein